LVVVSMYNNQKEGMGPNTGNWHRMMRVTEFIRHYSIPFIIGMDANVSAEAIHRSGWAKSMFGSVSHVSSGTRRSAFGNWSTIPLRAPP
jgi:hypothetical protein